MGVSGSEASDEFEFVETPAAPTPTPPAEDYGVRTTAVSAGYACCTIESPNTHKNLQNTV